MPVVKSDSSEVDKTSVHKGVIYLIGLGAFVVLWLIGYGSNMLVYTSLSPLPIVLPVIFSIPVALLFNRIARVYPGSAEIFSYVGKSMLAVAIAIIAMVTLSRGESWLEIKVATAVIGLIYPVVTLCFAFAVENFTNKLGLNPGGKEKLQHYDTIKANQRKAAAAVVGDSPTNKGIDVVDLTHSDLSHPVAESDVSGREEAEVDAKEVSLLDEADTSSPETSSLPTVVIVTHDQADDALVSDSTAERDFSKAIKVVKNKKGTREFIELDLEELMNATFPEKPEPEPEPEPKSPRKRTRRKTTGVVKTNSDND